MERNHLKTIENNENVLETKENYGKQNKTKF